MWLRKDSSKGDDEIFRSLLIEDMEEMDIV